MEYPLYLALFHHVTRGVYPRDSTEAVKRKIRFHSRKYTAHRGVLYEKLDEAGDNHGLELLHEGNAGDIIRTIHAEGHQGINNTWRRVCLNYTGPRLFERVRSIVQECATCQFRSRPQRNRYEPNRPIPTPAQPFHMVGCDAVGPIKQPNKADKYILVAIDYLTRWPMAAVVDHIDEKTTAEFLFNHIVMQYGVPSYLLTDRGSNFKAFYVEEFLKGLGCRHLTTTAYRPQTNGMCERLNQTLVQTIAKMARDEDARDSWEDYLGPALLAIRTMPNEGTKYSPSMLLFGYELRTPATWPSPRRDYVEGEIEEEIISRCKTIQHLSDTLREQARENAQRRKLQDKQRYDRNVGERRKFKIGEQVLMKDKGPKGKFDDRWLGPMVVTRVNGNGTYYLQGPNARRLEGAVHSDMLRPFHCHREMLPDVIRAADQQFRAWISRCNDNDQLLAA